MFRNCKTVHSCNKNNKSTTKDVIKGIKGYPEKNTPYYNYVEVGVIYRAMDYTPPSSLDHILAVVIAGY